jgi:hypothetical protein
MRDVSIRGEYPRIFTLSNETAGSHILITGTQEPAERQAFQQYYQPDTDSLIMFIPVRRTLKEISLRRWDPE